MTPARDQIISLDDTPYYHCMARCVRRAFLFGEDSVTGKSFDHRKAWVVDKLAFLADVFAIDVCAYAVMSNHYHVVLHVDSQRASSWSEKEVIERWMSLFSGNVLVARYMKGECKTKAEELKVSEFVEQWRERLTDISWFMRVLNESIARMANEEDDVKGRFWEGRFKSQALLDESAVLACMAYVDLNPIRAGIAELPEDSDFTSIQDRINELATRKVGRPRKAKPQDGTSALKKPMLSRFKNATNKKQRGDESHSLLDFTLTDYLELLDWTGRAVRPDKKGAIDENAPKILQRLGLSSSAWMLLMPNIETRFTHAVGNREQLQLYAESHDLSWVRGQGQTGIAPISTHTKSE